jgi:anti-sigma factor ChrR (cupin superfamily)
VFAVSRDALRAALARIPDASAWRTGFFPQQELLQTPELGRASVLIARLAPGAVIAKHPHPFRELTYVLDGALSEDGVRHFGPGELLEAAPGTEHAIAVEGDDACLVVFAIRRA